MLGKYEGRRRRGWQRMKWFDSITDSMHMNLSKLWEILEDRGACYATVHGITELNTHNLATEQQKQQHSNQNLKTKTKTKTKKKQKIIASLDFSNIMKILKQKHRTLSKRVTWKLTSSSVQSFSCV